MDVYQEWLGIPEGERPPDHYTLLRLKQFEDDPDRIRKNYSKLNGHVRKYASGQYAVRSQELLNELAKAMLCLTDPERKRELDESLGREFDDEDPGGRKPLGRQLVELGKITDEQMREAESFSDARGLSMRDAVVQMKLVDLETATQAFAQELGRSYVDLNNAVPDDSVLDKLPRNFVKRNQLLPLFVDDDVLLVASVYDLEPEVEDELRLRYDVPPRAVIATPLAVNQALSKYYAPGMRDEVAEAETGTARKGGKKPAKQKSAANKPAGRSASNQYSDEEKRKRKMVGILIACWGTIASVLLDQFLITKLLKWTFPFALTLIALPVSLAIAYFVYWKE